MEFWSNLANSDTAFARYVAAGGVMMFVLIPLSILALGFVIQLFLKLRRSRVSPDEIEKKAGDVEHPQDLEAFEQELDDRPETLAQTLLGYITAARRGDPYLPEENPAPLDFEIDRLYHSITPLTVIYTIAPLCGLLGTIIGMMETFYNFAVLEERDLAILSEGINKALVTTMWGLVIAVPSYVFAAILRGKVFRYEKDTLPHMTRHAMAVLGPIARRVGEKIPSQPTAQAPARPRSSDSEPSSAPMQQD